jgi:Restriction endonuclease.
MLSWLIALVLAIGCFALITAWLWLPARSRIERERGLADLADMHWRDFVHIIRRALIEKRGLSEIASGEQSPGEPRADWLMLENGQPCLISCKHGLSYRIGEAAVVELGTKIRLAGASSGLLVTQGSVAREGRELATRHRIDIIDGPQLWPLVRPYVPSELENAAADHAKRASIRRTGIAALGCLTLGLVIGLGLLGHSEQPPSRSPQVAVNSQPASPAQPRLATGPAAGDAQQEAPDKTAAQQHSPPHWWMELTPAWKTPGRNCCAVISNRYRACLPAPKACIRRSG